ncbi:MAG TPA: phage tail protein [bacterium]|nr:phage tail protein [bacterium]
MNETAAKDFRYFVINTPEKWRQGFGSSVLLNQDGHLTLTPKQTISSLGDLGHATGIAIDKQDNLFILDALCCGLFRYSRQDAALVRVNCFGGCGQDYGEFRFTSAEQKEYAGGLAFTGSTLLVADTYNHRVQGFYLPYHQIRFVLGREENCEPVPGTAPGEFNQPRDIVADSQGHFYVLDYGNRRIQKFNRIGQFRRLIGTDGMVEQPESFAIDATDCLYVLDSGKSTVEKFDSMGNYLGTMIDFSETDHPIQPSGIAVDPDQIIYVGEQRPGDDLRIHQFDADGRYLGAFGEYSDRCLKLIVDRNGGVYGSVGSDGQVLGFTGEEAYEQEGVYYTRVFDSTIEECTWHRMMLELEPAEKARLDVFFYASDNETTVEEIDANESWEPVLHSPENSVIGTDALFFSGVGRYLYLKFIFFGDGLHSYEVAQCRVYFERLSYLRYLPAVYQQDPAGRDFMERLLSLYESLNLEVEEEIAHMARFFDPEVVEDEFLEWVSMWVALMQDKNWPEEKRRAFLRRAYQLYKIRGTSIGLKEVIHLFTDAEVAIIEHFRLRSPMVIGASSTTGISTVVGKTPLQPLLVEESSEIGEFALKESPDSPQAPFEFNAFDFSLLADTSRLTSPEQLDALYRLIEEEKPAHTRCRIRTSEGEMQLGHHALLQVDTKLSRGFPAMRLGTTSCLGKNSYIGTYYCRRGMLEMRSSIAVDALLN